MIAGDSMNRTPPSAPAEGAPPLSAAEAVVGAGGKVLPVGAAEKDDDAEAAAAMSDTLQHLLLSELFPQLSKGSSPSEEVALSKFVDLDVNHNGRVTGAEMREMLGGDAAEAKLQALPECPPGTFRETEAGTALETKPPGCPSLPQLICLVFGVGGEEEEIERDTFVNFLVKPFSFPFQAECKVLASAAEAHGALLHKESCRVVGAAAQLMVGAAGAEAAEPTMSDTLQQLLLSELFPQLAQGSSPSKVVAMSKFVDLDVNDDGTVTGAEMREMLGGDAAEVKLQALPDKHPGCPSLPQLICLVFGVSSEEEEIERDTFVDFLCKPFSFKAECKVLKQFLLRQVFRVKPKKKKKTKTKTKTKKATKKKQAGEAAAEESGADEGLLSDDSECEEEPASVAATWDKDDPDALDVPRVRQLFAEVDADGNGELDKGEFAAVAERLGFEGLDELELDLCMGMFDTNANGTIDADEFINFLCTPLSGGAREERAVPTEREAALIRKYLLGTVFQVTSPRQLDKAYVRDVFLKADADSSGSISRDEFKTVISSLGFNEVTEYELHMFMSIFDRDGDGEVDYAEFSAFFFEDKLRDWRTFEVEGEKKRFKLMGVLARAGGHVQLTAGVRKMFEEGDKADRAKVGRVDAMVLRHYRHKL